MDKATLERLRQLELAKSKAVEMEEFDEAKRLKEAIERLRSVGSHLAQLEERKRIAIQSEDYDSAKIIKAEIERLRGAAANPIFQPGAHMQQNVGHAQAPVHGAP